MWLKVALIGSATIAAGIAGYYAYNYVTRSLSVPVTNEDSTCKTTSTPSTNMDVAMNVAMKEHAKKMSASCQTKISSFELEDKKAAAVEPAEKPAEHRIPVVEPAVDRVPVVAPVENRIPIFEPVTAVATDKVVSVTEKAEAISEPAAEEIASVKLEAENVSSKNCVENTSAAKCEDVVPSKSSAACNEQPKHEEVGAKADTKPKKKKSTFCGFKKGFLL